MAMTIEELRNAAAAINEVANWLAAQFSSDADATPVAEAKTEKKPELTLEEVRAVLAEKSRAGHTAAIRTLLQKYGATFSIGFVIVSSFGSTVMLGFIIGSGK